MRGGRLRHVVTLKNHIDLVPDPEFADATKWVLANPYITVSGGLCNILYKPSGTAYAFPTGNNPFVLGKNYTAEIKCIASNGVRGGAIRHYTTYLWQNDVDGVGTFTVPFTCIYDSPLYWLEISSFGGTATFDYFRVYDEDGIEVFAAIEPVSSKSRLTSHQYYGDTTHKVTLRYSSDIAAIDNSWRVVFGSRTFIITGVMDINERNQTILLHCKEGLREKNEPTV